MITRQDHYWTEAKPCKSVEDLKAACGSKEVAGTCREVRELVAQSEFTTDPALKEALEEQIRKKKEKLATAAYQATFKGERRKQEDAILNGLCFTDYDHIDNIRDFLDNLYAKHGGKEQFMEKFKVHFCQISVRQHGVHFVFEADAEKGNLADNQDWFDTIIGLKHDESCKDASRCCFLTTAADIEHIDEKLCTYDNPDFEARYGELYRMKHSNPLRGRDPQDVLAELKQGRCVKADDTAKAETPLADITPTEGLSPDTLFHGHTYREIQELLFKKMGGKPEIGERHSRMLQLANQMRYICDHDEAFLKSILIPLDNPLPPKEMDSILHDACKNKVYLMSAPKELRAVLNELGININPLSETESEDAHIRMHAKYYPKFQDLRLPPLFKAITAGVSEDLKIGMALAALPMLGTLLTGVKFRHYDGKLSRLTFFFFGVGEAASGKSNFQTLNDLLMKHLQRTDNTNRKAEKEYKARKEVNKNKREQERKPHFPIRTIPLQISNAMLAERLQNAVADHTDTDEPFLMHLYSFGSELSTLLRSFQGGAWIEKMDIYCKAFHSEKWGVDYKCDDSTNGEVEVNLNMAITGTEDVFDQFVNHKHILDGFPERIIYFPVPYQHFEMQKRGIGRTSAQEQLITQMGEELAQYTLPLEVNAKKITDALYAWCEKKMALAKELEDYEIERFCKRSALMGERAAVIFAIIENYNYFKEHRKLKVTRNAIDFGTFVADYAMESLYMKFGAKIREAKLKHRSTMGPQLQMGADWITIYSQLPHEFCYTDILHMDPTLKPATMRKRCQRWEEKGDVVRVSDGLYRKLKEQL